MLTTFTYQWCSVGFISFSKVTSKKKKKRLVSSFSYIYEALYTHFMNALKPGFGTSL